MSAPAVATRSALARVREAPSILDALDALEDVVLAARREGSTAAAVLAAALEHPSDPLEGLAALHGAGAAGPEVAEALLVPLLSDGCAHRQEHAAWALGAGPVVPAAVDALRSLAASGGFVGTLAEATLEGWEEPAPEASGASPVRRAPSASDEAVRPGLTVAQLYLHGELDGSLRNAGRGDTGGIATLLVQLGDALLREPGIERVLTLSRASQSEESDQITEDVAPGQSCRRRGHSFLGIGVPRPVPPASRSWSLRSAAVAGLRRHLTEAGRVDVLHLRMADVGSWAGAQVARELGIPVVLTLAPDPHHLIAAREAEGLLSRQTFLEADLAEHLVFRLRLLRTLREQAAALVVFPRPELEDDLRTLLHLDPEHDVHVVAEGIDVGVLDEADRAVALALTGRRPSTEAAGALAELDALLSLLPDERRGLPLVLSVGRLHAVKGMATLARAWLDHPDLADRCNLVIVGGDLEEPTSDESEQLVLLDAVVHREDGPGRGLLLAGHRGNATVAVWLAAARRGRPGLSAPGGVYACASLKEEFGIALLEALGSGLVVVAPEGGGPPTYVEHGRTGVLVDTRDPVALGEAVAAALDLAVSPGTEARAQHARQVVADRFGIATMAGALARVYAEVAR